MTEWEIKLLPFSDERFVEQHDGAGRREVRKLEKTLRGVQMPNQRSALFVDKIQLTLKYTKSFTSDKRFKFCFNSN